MTSQAWCELLANRSSLHEALFMDESGGYNSSDMLGTADALE